MNFPDNLKYTKDHEWVRVEGNVAVIGITDFAQSELGDIVYVEIETEGEELKKEDIFLYQHVHPETRETFPNHDPGEDMYPRVQWLGCRTYARHNRSTKN